MAISIAELTATAIVYDTDAENVVETDVRSGATTLYGIYVDNSANANIVYLKIFDNVNPSLGSTEPDMVVAIEANNAVPNAGDAFIPVNGGTGMAFANGLSFACVTGIATGDTTAPGAAVKVALMTS